MLTKKKLSKQKKEKKSERQKQKTLTIDSTILFHIKDVNSFDSQRVNIIIFYVFYAVIINFK